MGNGVAASTNHTISTSPGSPRAEPSQYGNMPTAPGALRARGNSKTPARTAGGDYDSALLINKQLANQKLNPATAPRCPTCNIMLPSAPMDAGVHVSECAKKALKAREKQAKFPFSCAVCGNAYQYETDLNLHHTKRHAALGPRTTSTPAGSSNTPPFGGVSSQQQQQQQQQQNHYGQTPLKKVVSSGPTSTYGQTPEKRTTNDVDVTVGAYGNVPKQ